MSNSVTYRSNHTNDDNSNYDPTMNSNIKFLTPRKYRTPKRAQLPNVFPGTNIEISF